MTYDERSLARQSTENLSTLLPSKSDADLMVGASEACAWCDIPCAPPEEE